MAEEKKKNNVKETVPVKDNVKETRETEKNIGTVKPVIDRRRVWRAEAIPLGSDTKGNDIVAVRQSGVSGGLLASEFNGYRQKWRPGSKFYLFQKDSEGQLSPMSWKEFTSTGKDVGQKLKTIVSAWNKAIEMDSSVKEPVNGYTLVFQGTMAKMSNEHVLVETTPLDDDHKLWQQSHAEDFSKPNTGLSSQKDHGLMTTDKDVQATLPPRRVPSQSMQESTARSASVVEDIKPSISDGGSATKKETESINSFMKRILEDAAQKSEASFRDCIYDLWYRKTEPAISSGDMWPLQDIIIDIEKHHMNEWSDFNKELVSLASSKTGKQKHDDKLTTFLDSLQLSKGRTPEEIQADKDHLVQCVLQELNFISSKDSLKEHQDQSDNRHTHSATGSDNRHTHAATGSDKRPTHSATKDYGLGR